MGDAGEGLIDADSRIQERMEELERERKQSQTRVVRDPEKVRALESLRLARTELERQLGATTNEQRRGHINQAIAEITRRMEALQEA
jgi:phosphopantetheinyl transferase